MKYDVFISYKSQSINVVNAIVHVLEQEGILCWYAPRNLDDNAVGKNYADIIVETIRESRILIVVLSNAALVSDWVQAEVEQALDTKKHVIPFVVSELQIDNGLRMRLKRKHWIDAYPNPDKKFALLLKNVKQLLNELSSGNGTNTGEQRFNLNVETKSAVDYDYEEGMALLAAKEYNDAAISLIASAERGNDDAKNQLCQLFYDKNDSLELFQNDIWNDIEQQAQKGHCYANFIMHCKLYKDASKNLVSFEYLKNARKKNSIPLAFLRMGIQYNWGMGIKQSHTLGMHYYLKAMNMGCKESYSYIAQEYLYGTEKIQKNEDKAFTFLQQGIDAGDMRSFTKMAYYYLHTKHEKENAIEIAKKAIEQGHNEGYCLMGDIYCGDGQDIEQDLEEATKWYKEALKHDEKSAYGMLAAINENSNREFSYAMARRGRFVGDGFSSWILGWLYENDNNFEEAWKCYSEKYERDGTGADNLARLVMEKKFVPSFVSTDTEREQLLDELEQRLEIQARNNNKDCLNALLRFYSFRLTGNNEIDYEIAQKVPKAADIIQLGAEMGMSEMMYYMGNSMMNQDNPKTYNPYKGLEWLEKSAIYTNENNNAISTNSDAINKLLLLYHSGVYKDDDAFYRIANLAIKYDVYNNETASLIININISHIKDKEEYKEFIRSLLSDDNSILQQRMDATMGIIKLVNDKKLIIDSLESSAIIHLINTKVPKSDIKPFCDFLKNIYNQDLDKKIIFAAIARFIDLSTERSVHISEKDKNFFYRIIKEEIVSENYGYLPIFRKYINSIFPDYNDDEAICDILSNKDTINSRIYYGLSTNDIPSEIDIKSQDFILNKLYLPIINQPQIRNIVLNDSNYKSILGVDTAEIFEPIYNLVTSYEAICKQFNIKPLSLKRPNYNDAFPFFSSVSLHKIRKDVLRCLLSIRNCDQIISNQFLQKLDNDEELLNICERIQDQNIQLFLISFIELNLDSESIMYSNSKVLRYFFESHFEKLSDELNHCIGRIEKEGIQLNLPKFTLDNIPISDKNQKDLLDIINERNEDIKHTAFNQNIEESDEFERLLNDFINSSSEEESTQEKA